MNNMIKMTTEHGTAYFACPVSTTDATIAHYEQFAAQCDTDVFFDVFTVGKMPLDQLPEDTQTQVRHILKAFDHCGVVFEYGRFAASAGCCIKSSYGFDHFVCGEYKACEVYTPEERRQNYLESFGYAARF